MEALRNKYFAFATMLVTLPQAASAQEPIPAKPNVPVAEQPEPPKITPKPYKEQTEPMRKATLARVIELLGAASTENDEERMKALNVLEAALVPLGPTQMLDQTRCRILEELKVDVLAKKLEREKGGEDPDTVAALMRLREHDNYFIRNRVERLFSACYKDRPAEDPRHRPPDIGRLTRHIDTASVHSVGDLANTKQMTALREEIRKTTDRWERNDYKERELARKELAELVRQTKGLLGVQEIVENELTPQRAGKSWAGKWNDLEVRRSAENLVKLAHETQTNETLYPPYRSSIGQVLQDMRTFGGAGIRFSENENHEHVETPLQTNGRTSHSRLLAQICELTGTYPDCDGSPTRLALKKQDAKAPREVIALDGAVGVVTPGNETAPPSILLLPDPQAVFLDLEKAEAKQLNSEKYNVRVSRSVDPDWKFVHSGGKPAVRQRSIDCKDAVKRDLFAGQGTLSYTVWTATHPVSRVVIIGDRAAYSDGPQDVTIGEPEETGKNRWNVRVTIGMYDGRIPWANTPHESDTKTYAAAEVTDIRFFDAKGGEIASSCGPMSINLRMTDRTYALPGKPVSAKVTTYRGIREIRIDQPLDGSPATRTLVEPWIKTSGQF